MEGQPLGVGVDLQEAEAVNQFYEQLRFMAAGGSSVTLNYGEDSGNWECSWISGGRRFTEFARDPGVAAMLVLRKVKEAMEAVPEAGLNEGFYRKIVALLE